MKWGVRGYSLHGLVFVMYTNFDENITRVHVCKISISDHYAIVGNRKLNNCVK